jgi:uncharacterized protein
MEQTFFSRKSNQVLASLALFMVVVALGMYSHYTWVQSEYMNYGPTTISVTGEGEVQAIPDIGEFSFSVNAEGDDAATAQTESATKINAILAYLKAEGIEEKDIKTEYYNLYPKYRYEERVCMMNTYCPPGEQVPDGFEVSQSVRVKVRSTDTAGQLISGVGDLGATNISSLSFTIDDESALTDAARTAAIEDAQAKAEVLAKQLGVRIVKMMGYYEDEGYGQPYYGMGSAMEMKSVSMDAVAPEMPTGENTISRRVTITYQIR